MSRATGSWSGLAARYLRRLAGQAADDAELDELADAVLDVLAHAAERLHQRFDVEGFFGAGAQKAEDAGAQRRLHQRAESGVEVLLGRGGVPVVARRAAKVRSSTADSIYRLPGRAGLPLVVPLAGAGGPSCRGLVLL